LINLTTTSLHSKAKLDNSWAQ